MSEADPTCIGRVRHVLGSTVTVALDPDLAGVAPIYRGKLQSVGQIGSIVRFPQGLVDLIGAVSLVGIAELTPALPPVENLQVGERWLQVQLLGEIDSLDNFQRGVGSYPGLDDPVHFATPEDLGRVFPVDQAGLLKFGSLSSAPAIPVCLDPAKLVLRHTAVVGSTGSGKTSAVAELLQGLTSGEWPGANVVVIDPHGEYARAIGDKGSVRSVLDPKRQLRVPYWALSAEDILKAFTGVSIGATTLKRWSAFVAKARIDFVEKSSWLNLDPSAITADTPVPFDIREVWHAFDFENRETREAKGDPNTVCIEEKGDPKNLKPTRFVPYKPGGAKPDQGPDYETHGRIPELLRLALEDPDMAFLQQPEADPKGEDPLRTAMIEWLGEDRAISVLDFSGVPTAVADLAIGVVLDLLFELALRSKKGESGIGRPRPILFVLEEAHRYLNDDEANQVTARAAGRIAREGRKYGVGLLMVTQRPSELPETALAQCGTLIALRLTNGKDQGQIRSALPDNVTGLADVLPSLRTGEAVVSGEAIVLPVRTTIDEPDPYPEAEDPGLESWREKAGVPDLVPALAKWRGLYDPPKPSKKGKKGA
jgi:Helicase HerA, central domain